MHLVGFRSKIAVGVTAAAAILLLVMLVSYRSAARDEENSRWVSHTHEVLETLYDFEANLATAQQGEHDFVLTHDDSYLTRYSTALEGMRKDAKQLRSLTSDNPTQQRALDLLDPLVFAASPASLPRNIRAEERSLGDLFVRSKLITSGMKQEERRLLLKRSSDLDASSRQTRSAILFGDALGFSLLLAAGFLVQREMRQRRTAEDQIRTLNADLERRVADRTAELAERAKDLERSNTELQQFAYVASHDLQEPLRTISSFTQLLAKRYQDKLDDKAREFIGFAVDGCKRMQTLINDLLAYSRVGTHGKPLEPVQCDQVVDRVVKSLSRAIEDTGALITHAPLPVVMADEVQLSQLFQNLIGNAIKFHGDGQPTVHIGADRNREGWKIFVRDNGIGIPPEHRDRIFIIFQRLHNRTAYPGTGIGLAICKKIAERHGGRIWVEASAGAGSTFFFTIPSALTHTTQEQNQYELRSSPAH